MRILFVHEVNYNSKVIYEMHEFPELLALAGHDVSFFHFPEAPSTFARSFRTSRTRIPGRAYPNASITLITPPTAGGAVWERYAAPLTNLPALHKEIKQGKYDLIVLYSVPTTGWQTVRLAQRFGVPVVFRALDASHLIRRNLLTRAIKIAERYVYRSATVLSANNPAMARYCIEFAGRTGLTVVNLPPVDLTHFAGSPGTSMRSTLGLTEDEKVLLYMGSFFAFSGLETLIRHLVPEFERHPDLRLVLVGGGEIDSKLRLMVAELGLTARVLFTGMVGYDALPAYLAMANVALNPFEPQLLTDVALPHKVLQYLAAGALTVSTSLEGLRAVVGENAGVVWVDRSDDVATVAVELAYASVGGAPQFSAAKRQEVIDQFSRSAALDSFATTLETARGIGRSHDSRDVSPG